MISDIDIWISMSTIQATEKQSTSMCYTRLYFNHVSGKNIKVSSEEDIWRGRQLWYFTTLPARRMTITCHKFPSLDIIFTTMKKSFALKNYVSEMKRLGWFSSGRKQFMQNGERRIYLWSGDTTFTSSCFLLAAKVGGMIPVIERIFSRSSSSVTPITQDNFCSINATQDHAI